MPRLVGLPHRSTRLPSIDFNCDLGEGCGDDAAIIPLLSSASIACGGHAGDADNMRRALRLCRTHGVAAGAHPSYPDREHFGRRDLPLPPADIADAVRAQIGQLMTLARQEGIRLAHVKPHGALYNRAADDEEVADAIAATVASIDRDLRLFGLSGSALTRAGARHGLRVAHEVFAERGYDARGRLLPRGTPGAELETVAEAVAQVRALVVDGRAPIAGGGHIALRADTLCLHGDRADAAAFACALRDALTEAGVTIQPVPIHDARESR